MVLLMIVTFFLERAVLSWLDLGNFGLFNRLTSEMPWYLDLARIGLSLLFALIGFVPAGLYSLVVGYWRQSMGRALMHVRVVNKYGLKPSARLMMSRDALRMIWLWVTPTILFVQSGGFWATIATAIVCSAAGLFWLADVAFCAFGRGNRSLHDRWLETFVVLDTEGQL